MSKAAKRQRTGDSTRSFGAPAKDLETAIFQTNAPSTRTRTESVPTLVNMCSQRFVSCFKELRSNNNLWESRISQQLQQLPEAIVPIIFAMLRKSHPGFLSHAIIVTYFMRGTSLSLPSDSLPGAGEKTILAIPRVNVQVRDLDLSGYSELGDEVFAKVITQLQSLRSLVLRKCSKAGSKTVAAIVKSCPDIRSINLNETSVLPGAVAELLLARGSELEVLKIAGLERWTEAAFISQFQNVVKDNQPSMPRMHTLKLRGLQISDASIHFFVSLFPNLKHLDISFTAAKSFAPKDVSPPPPLKKLNLTSTMVSTPSLIAIMPSFSGNMLHTLSLGALGMKGSVGISSAVTLNDATLRQLTGALSSCPNLHSVNLMSNTKLCTTSKTALFDFIEKVGRRLLHLNLSGIPSLRSNALVSLLPLEDESSGPPALETLVLNNTSVDDDSGAYIACCSNLVRLEVEGTRFTSEGLFTILDTCTKLDVLNLTSCRGVKLQDRRRFFEVWQSQRSADEE